MKLDLLCALRLLLVKRRAHQTKRQVLDRLTSADYARSHSLPSVKPARTQPLPPLRLDDYRDPPFFRKYSAPVVNGVRVLGDKTDD